MKKNIRKEITCAAVAFFLLFCCYPSQMATGRGKPQKIIYNGGLSGKVIFDHKLHASKGIYCHDCHTEYMRTGQQLFMTRKQSLISPEDHKSGQKCFACHNGKMPVEFAGTDSLYQWNVFNDCEQCHYPSKSN